MHRDRNKKAGNIAVLSVVLLIILAGICSCAANNEVLPAEDYSGQDNKSLKIYRYEHEGMMSDALRIFKAKYPEVSVQEEIFKSSEGYSEMGKRLNTELMAGEGPDVIMGTWSLFNSLYKVLETGVFFDIDKLVKNDRDFDLSAYNETVLNAGIHKGKRLFIPLDFNIPCLLTTKAVINESGLEFDMDDWTWERLLEQGKAFAGGNGSNQNKYMFSSYYELLDCLFLSSGIKYADYDKKKTAFDSPEFIELLEKYKEFLKYTMPVELMISYQDGFYSMFEDKSLLAVNQIYSDSLNPRGLWMHNSIFRLTQNTEVSIYPFPAMKKGNGPLAVVHSIAAINSKSGSKHSAYELIKVLLSEDVQSSGALTYIPVNLNAFENMITRYSGKEGSEKINTGTLGNFVQISGVPMTEELVRQLRYAVSQTDLCEVFDGNIYDFIWEEAQNYINDKITARQAAVNINNKVMLFLNE